MEAVLEKPKTLPSAKVLIHFPPELALTDALLLGLSSANSDLRLERNAQGDLVVMAPTGFDSSDRNSEINYQLRAWSKKTGRGKVTDSSGGFKLPNGATRAPDAAWVSDEVLATLSPDDFEKFLPICPEFVIELRSASDNLDDLKEKMEEYIANGTKLGWLLDAKTKNVYVYTPEGVTLLEAPERVKGSGRLESFELNLLEVW